MSGTGRKSPPPRHTPRAQAAKTAREARLAAQMRKNLARRKTRQRALEAGAKDEPAD